jgi:hypothetical protein
MITRLKLFEKITIDDDYSFFIIYGNQSNAIAILRRLKDERLNEIIDGLENNIWRGRYKHSIATFIYYYNIGHSTPFTYSTINDMKEKEVIFGEHSKWNFKGELKLDDNWNIVLDTFEADTKKYNL